MTSYTVWLDSAVPLQEKRSRSLGTFDSEGQAQSYADAYNATLKTGHDSVYRYYIKAIIRETVQPIALVSIHSTLRPSLNRPQTPKNRQNTHFIKTQVFNILQDGTVDLSIVDECTRQLMDQALKNPGKVVAIDQLQSHHYLELASTNDQALSAITYDMNNVIIFDKETVSRH